MFKIKEKGITKYSPSWGMGLATTSVDGEPVKSNTLNINLGKRYWYIEVPYILKHTRKWRDFSMYELNTIRKGFWESINKEYSFKFNTGDCSGLFLYYGSQDEDDREKYKFKLISYPWEHHFLGRQVLDKDGQRACSHNCFKDMYEFRDNKDNIYNILCDDQKNDNHQPPTNRKYYGKTVLISNIVHKRIFIDPFDNEEILGKIYITKSFYTRGRNKFFRFLFGTLLGMNEDVYSLNIDFEKEFGSGKVTWKGGTLSLYQPIDSYNGDIDMVLETNGYKTMRIPNRGLQA